MTSIDILTVIHSNAITLGVAIPDKQSLPDNKSKHIKPYPIYPAKPSLRFNSVYSLEQPRSIPKAPGERARLRVPASCRLAQHRSLSPQEVSCSCHVLMCLM